MSVHVKRVEMSVENEVRDRLRSRLLQRIQRSSTTTGRGKDDSVGRDHLQVREKRPGDDTRQHRKHDRNTTMKVLQISALKEKGGFHIEAILKLPN